MPSVDTAQLFKAIGNASEKPLPYFSCSVAHGGVDSCAKEITRVSVVPAPVRAKLRFGSVRPISMEERLSVSHSASHPSRSAFGNCIRRRRVPIGRYWNQ